MIDFLKYVLMIILGTVGIFVLCGLLIALANKAFRAMLGRFIPAVCSIIGTPVHEIGHLLMCLVFWHRIVRVRLWQLPDENGVMGFVEHSYNRKNPYKTLGNLFIGIGPIISGLLAVMLTMRLCFPTVYSDYVGKLTSDTSIAEAAKETFLSLFSMVRSVGSEVNVFVGILGLFIIISVCLHITLSKSDVKSCFRAIVPYLVLVLAFALLTTLLGLEAKAYALLLSIFFSALRVFMLIICIEFSLIAIALPLWIVRKIIRR